MATPKTPAQLIKEAAERTRSADFQQQLQRITGSSIQPDVFPSMQVTSHAPPSHSAITDAPVNPDANQYTITAKQPKGTKGAQKESASDATTKKGPGKKVAAKKATVKKATAQKVTPVAKTTTTRSVNTRIDTADGSHDTAFASLPPARPQTRAQASTAVETTVPLHDSSAVSQSHTQERLSYPAPPQRPQDEIGLGLRALSGSTGGPLVQTPQQPQLSLTPGRHLYDPTALSQPEARGRSSYPAPPQQPQRLQGETGPGPRVVSKSSEGPRVQTPQQPQLSLTPVEDHRSFQQGAFRGSQPRQSSQLHPRLSVDPFSNPATGDIGQGESPPGLPTAPSSSHDVPDSVQRSNTADTAPIAPMAPSGKSAAENIIEHAIADMPDVAWPVPAPGFVGGFNVITSRTDTLLSLLTSMSTI